MSAINSWYPFTEEITILGKEIITYKVTSWGDDINLFNKESNKNIGLIELCDTLFNGNYYVYKIKYFDRIDQELKRYGIEHRYNELKIYIREE